MALAEFVTSMATSNLPTVPGTAVYLTPRPEKVPHSLLHSLKHYKCLHERVVILEIRFANTPFVPAGRRVEVEPLGGRFFRVRATFGFMDQPHLTRTLHTCASHGLVCDAADSTFFLGPRNLIPSARRRWPIGASCSSSPCRAMPAAPAPTSESHPSGGRARRAADALTKRPSPQVLGPEVHARWSRASEVQVVCGADAA